MASIASDSGHSCDGDDCVVCAVNIANDTVGRQQQSAPKKTAKPDRVARSDGDIARLRRRNKRGQQ